MRYLEDEMKAVATKQDFTIGNLLEDFELSAAKLFESVDRLDLRIRPILLPESGSEADTPGMMPAQSEMFQRLMMLKTKIEDQTNRLCNLSNRVDL